MIKVSYLMTSWTFSDFWTEIVSGMLSNMSNIDLDKVVESLSKVRDSKIIKSNSHPMWWDPWDFQKTVFLTENCLWINCENCVVDQLPLKTSKSYQDILFSLWKAFFNKWEFLTKNQVRIQCEYKKTVTPGL